MDTFLEYLVKKKSTPKAVAQKILLIFGTIVFIFLMFSLCILFPRIMLVFLCLIAGGIYGAWWLMGTFKVEYEYIVTNGEMDVDKIIAQRKRKRLVTVKFREMELMAPVTGSHRHEFETKTVDKTIDACILPDDKGTYFLIIRHPKLGMLRLIFSPDDRIIKSAKTAAPHRVFTD